MTRGFCTPTCSASREHGWTCDREAGVVHHGRVVRAGPDTHGLSIDGVDMKDRAGPHHVHSSGEIGLVMPRVPPTR